ncbi:hypothetical protein FACS189431_3000 [Alphaproteobacteria bacterium]|nr:hypothetical protein FACS189431_3000 [Alphaproteobacteria bacterium]
MKKDLHPQDYRLVVFQDEAAGFSFLTRSTAASDETVQWEDGKEYPLVKIYISSASHPFFTGEEKIIDTEGRVDRFAAKMKAAAEAKAAKAKKVAGKAAKKVEKNIDPVADTVSDAVDTAADKITDVVEKIADAKDDVIDKVASAAHNAVDKAEEKLDEK